MGADISKHPPDPLAALKPDHQGLAQQDKTLGSLRIKIPQIGDGIPGLLPVVLDLPIRFTESFGKNQEGFCRQILPLSQNQNFVIRANPWG